VLNVEKEWKQEPEHAQENTEQAHVLDQLLKHESVTLRFHAFKLMETGENGAATDHAAKHAKVVTEQDTDPATTLNHQMAASIALEMVTKANVVEVMSCAQFMEHGENGQVMENVQNHADMVTENEHVFAIEEKMRKIARVEVLHKHHVIWLTVHVSKINNFWKVKIMETTTTSIIKQQENITKKSFFVRILDLNEYKCFLNYANTLEMFL